MINCQNITFSQTLSNERIEKAYNLFGEKVVKRIIALSFYWCGVNRTQISEIVKLPLNTVKSCIRNLLSTGITAFEDRRKKVSAFLPIEKKHDTSILLFNDNDNFIIKINSNIEIKIQQKNKLQLKTLILTFLNNNLIDLKHAAKALNLSDVHVCNLAKAIESEDVHCLLDKRKGQTKDYKVNPEIKGELIQQFALASISKQKTSGKAISKQLKNRCQLDLSERTIRHHIEKLGLQKIKKSLPKMYDELKKNSAQY